MQMHSKSRVSSREKGIEGKKMYGGYRKFCFEKQHIAVQLGSSMSAVCCWTVISNGSYGHLNNHLAHPPSLNSHYFFSPSRLFLCFFSRNLGAIEGARSDDSRKTTALTGFPFFYRYQLTGTLIRHCRKNRITYDEITDQEIPIEGHRSWQSRWKITDRTKIYSVISHYRDENVLYNDVGRNSSVKIRLRRIFLVRGTEWGWISGG